MNEVFLGAILFTIFLFATIFMYRVWTPVLDSAHSAVQDLYGEEQEDIVSRLKIVWQYAPFMFLVLFLIYVIYLVSKREQYEYGV
jgi:hypothetical protein